MVSEDVLRECREYIAANEASAKEYLNRYFVITEYSLSRLGTTVLFEFAYMPVEDIEKTPDISYNDKAWLPPATSTQSPEAIVPMKWLKVPEHLSNLKCYRLSPRLYVTKPLLFKEGPSEGLETEEHEMSGLLVFHLSSFLSLMHRRYPFTEKAIEEYDKRESLRELNRLISSS